MLSREENELMCRVGEDKPMGQMLRMYWLPVCMSEEVAEADGAPVQVKMLGEDLVIFRNTNGEIGLVDAQCPHRTAPLVFGRNEECGLRCIYHGWKFDIHGNCVDMPSEPTEHNFKNRAKIKSYPVREIGGLVWAYFGPLEKMPAFPEYNWTQLPSKQIVIAKAVENCNYVQAAEGVIDSAHSWFLHSGFLLDSETRFAISQDYSPVIKAENMPYGFRYAAIRKPVENPDQNQYVRVTSMAFPTTGFVPPSLDKSVPVLVQIFVPMDDEHTMAYSIQFSQDGSELNKHKVRESLGMLPKVDLDENWRKLRTRDNMYGQDRQKMKTESYSGIYGFPNQDFAMQEGMGTIADRTKEHLGTSDIAIIHYRRLLLDSVNRFMKGEKPIGLRQPIQYDRIVAEQKIIPIDENWKTVGVYSVVGSEN